MNQMIQVNLMSASVNEDNTFKTYGYCTFSDLEEQKEEEELRRKKRKNI